jgi:CHASE2 domain-containing sensor protein
LAEARQKAKREPLKRHNWQRWAVFITASSVAGFTIILRLAGLLQPLELAALDLSFRLRPPEPADKRVVIVEITQADIRLQKRWPFSDRVIALLLEKLQRYQPKVIGLGLYRDIPTEPGHEKLVAQLERPNLIAIRSFDNATGPLAPPEVPAEQVGFNELPIDPDNVIRRNILFAGNASGILHSFSLRVALAYLKQQGLLLQESQSHPGSPQLGKAVFLRLKENSGGYQNIDAGGYQVLLNYRASQNVARQVSLTQVLNGSVEPDWFKDKIVLIGSTAPSLKDHFYTPYSPALHKNHQMAGVLIHAQMVSQFLDAATGRRSLFRFWPEPIEWLWIFSWAWLGASLSWRFLRSGSAQWSALSILLSGAGLASGCYLAFLVDWWLPLVPPMLTLGFSAIAISLATSPKLEKLQLRCTLELIMEAYHKNPAAGRIAIEYLKRSESRRHQILLDQWQQEIQHSNSVEFGE